VISKGLRGSRLGGLVKYLFGPGRHEEHSNQRVVACSDPTWVGTATPDVATLSQLIAELDDPMVRYGDRTKDGYVYHVVVSIPAEDGALTDAQWQHSAQTFADRLGLDEQVQWVAVRHGTSANGNDHIHMVVNLIRGDGQLVNLWQDGLKRRSVCLELEEKYSLTGTSPAGLGEGSLSRREVEQVRSGRVATVTDLTRHRVSTTVRAVATGARSEPEFVERLRGEGLIARPRLDKSNPGLVVGYSVAARGGDADGKLVWYGGGTLGKDLRLPALRTKWQQTPQQRVAAASAWTSQTQLRRKAEPENLAGASTALQTVASLLEQVPTSDQNAWYRAATDSAGVLAAAATATTDEQVRRTLIEAWKSIHRVLPPDAATTTGATDVGAVPDPVQAEEMAPATVGVLQRNAVVGWPRSETGELNAAAQQASSLLAGVSRVLMAARLADAPQLARVRALMVQAVQLAAQISRTIAARQDATEAQRRAAAATARAADAAGASTRPSGWQFSKTGAEVIDASRTSQAVGGGPTANVPRPTGPAQGPQQPEQGR